MTDRLMCEAIDSVKDWLDAAENWLNPWLVADIRQIIKGVEFAAFHAPVFMAALDRMEKDPAFQARQKFMWDKSVNETVLDPPMPPDASDWLPEDDSDPEAPIPYELSGLANIMRNNPSQAKGYPKGRGCSYRMVDGTGTRLLVGTVTNCQPCDTDEGDTLFWDVWIAAVDPIATKDLVTTVTVGTNGVSICGNARVFGPHPFEAFSD